MSGINQPSDEEILSAVTARALATVNKCAPGIVVSYDEAAQTATVQPAIQERGEDPTPLLEVPIAFPQGGGFAVTFPLAAGDPVLVIYTDQDPSAYQSSGEVSPPTVLRRHGRYPYAIPCSRPGAPMPHEAGALVISKGATRFVLDSSAAYVGASVGAQALALAPLVEARLQALETWAAAHTHAVAAAPGTSASALPALVPPGPVAATKAKGI